MAPEAECILAIIGATPKGRKELLGFHVGVQESAQSWRADHRPRGGRRRRGAGVLEGAGQSVPERPPPAVLVPQDFKRSEQVRRDNQDATGATIRMRARRRWRTEGRA